MPSEFRNLKSMPDESLENHLRESLNQQSQHLTDDMTRAQEEIDAVLSRYSHLNEGAILRVALGKRQSKEAKRYIDRSQKFGNVSFTYIQNVYPDPAEVQKHQSQFTTSDEEYSE